MKKCPKCSSSKGVIKIGYGMSSADLDKEEEICFL
jgi:transposase-like protein